MSVSGRLVISCALVLSFLGCTAASGGGGTGPKPCTAAKDCPTGQLCKQQQCVTLPCGGRCSNDEVCQNDTCKVADGLSCKDDPSVCPSGFVCSPAGACARNCSADTDCSQPGFKSCNTDTGFCGECTFDTDCDQTSDRKFCDKTTAACVGCTDAKSCYVNGVPAGKICDPATHQCQAGCHGSTDCALGQRCDGGSASSVGRCVQCEPSTEANDCVAAPDIRCDPATLQCVECLSNQDCPSAQCNTTTKKCVECVQNEVCAKGYICNLDSNACVPGCAGGNGGANCPAELPVCDPNRGDHGLCVACLKDADCPRTTVCDLNGQQVNGLTVPKCVQGCKDTDTGRADDARCIDTTGAQPAPTDQKCDGDIGTHGECVQCASPADCPSTQTCDATTHKCRCKQTGESCTTNAECGYNPATQTCTTSGAACINTVHCNSSGDHPISPICSQTGTGLPEQNDRGNCPSGFVSDYAYDVNHHLFRACVPSPNRCQ